MLWRGSVILLILAAVSAPAQRVNQYLYPIREGSKFGFIDRTGAIVVPPTYEAVGELHEGRVSVIVRVGREPKSGYIDLSGKLVIEPTFDSAGEFRGSRAVVRVGDKYS